MLGCLQYCLQHIWLRKSDVMWPVSGSCGWTLFYLVAAAICFLTNKQWSCGRFEMISVSTACWKLVRKRWPVKRVQVIVSRCLRHLPLYFSVQPVPNGLFSLLLLYEFCMYVSETCSHCVNDTVSGREEVVRTFPYIIQCKTVTPLPTYATNQNHLNNFC